MKQILLFLSLFFITSALSAQVSLKFSHTNLSTTGNPNDFEVIGHAYVVNIGSSTVQLKWDREEIDFPDGWTSAVCDKNQCYGSPVSTNVGMVGGFPINIPVVLNPGDTSIMDLHLYPGGIKGTGKVDLCISTTDNPGTIIGCINYDFNLSTVSTKDLSKAGLKVYPNPTFDFFNVQNAEGVGFVKVYNTLGRLVKIFDASLERNFYVGDLPSGMYLVNLQNKSGKTIKTTRIIKKSLMP